jgi:hypothetical protein
VEKSAEALVWMAAFMVAGLTATAVYRWRLRRRAGRVQALVKDHLVARYGALPGHLKINCSDDPLWPVLASYRDPDTGAPRIDQYAYGGQPSSFRLIPPPAPAGPATAAVGP